jgi:tRNA/rRNA methyltransferase
MDNSDNQPLFVLVNPQMGENIGAAARAMWNFGLDRMAVVGPRDGWPNPKAVAMASGAGRVLDGAMLSNRTGDAIGNCDYVFATTARHRGLTKPVVDPETAMAQIRALIGEGKCVAVLFGPERAGLENSDVTLADAVISVPVNPEFASLNLAQCVLLLAYEWQRQTGAASAGDLAMARIEYASKMDVEKLGDHYQDQLDQAGFFYPEGKSEGMKLNLRNMWSRLALTRGDVQILHGVLRQMVRWKDGK